MTTPFGLGAISSPIDERDWQIDALYAAGGLTPVASPPLEYLAPAPYPPILNQGDSPKCVAFGNSTLKAYQDLRDTGVVDLDESRFFTAIGGTVNGAVPRYALERLLDVGYPEQGGANSAKHKIVAYYAVPLVKADIQSAIQSFGPIGLSFEWPWSWFTPKANGQLPAPSTTAGGHFLAAIGWSSLGLRLRNSWGQNYGVSGDVWMPWTYLYRAKEAWRAIDQVLVPPPATQYRIRLSPSAKIMAVRSFNGSCIESWLPAVYWGSTTSTAPCWAPQYRKGCLSGGANLAFVPAPAAAAIANRWVRIGTGVSVVTV